MNDAQHAAWLAYIREIANTLLLHDWDITLSRAISESSIYRAEIALHRERDEANIELSDVWFGRTPEQQRQTLVHELLHIHTTRLCRVVTRLHERLGSDVTTYVENAHDEEEEILVDRLARILAPYLPLPPEIA